MSTSGLVLPQAPVSLGMKRAQSRRGIYCSSRRMERGHGRALRPTVCQADGNDGGNSPGVPVSPSQHSSTSPVVKGLVSGLTRVVNLLAGVDAAAQSTAEDSRAPLGPSELLEGVEKDFTENGYLWSGEIDPNLYALDCTFTDPTLSFQGLDVFERNIRNLKPWLDRLLRNERCELLGIELVEQEREVRARWLMAGDVRLPWGPRVELTGRTRFCYSPESGGRVRAYVEEWDIPASEAVWQLLRPAGPPQDPPGSA